MKLGPILREIVIPIITIILFILLVILILTGKYDLKAAFSLYDNCTAGCL